MKYIFRVDALCKEARHHYLPPPLHYLGDSFYCLRDIFYFQQDVFYYPIR